MIFDWFRLFSLPEFEATELISRKLLLIMEGYGEKEVLITRGNEISLMYEDTFLPIEFQDANPYTREGTAATYAVYKDSEDYIWLGIEVSG